MKMFHGKELLKFCVGGGSAVFVDLAVYSVLKNGMDVPAAKAVSFVSGAAVGFLINKLWTFESRMFRISEILKYIALYACSAAVNAAVNQWVLNVSGMTMTAFFAATGCSTVINFLGQKFFVFMKKQEGG